MTNIEALRAAQRWLLQYVAVFRPSSRIGQLFVMDETASHLSVSSAGAKRKRATDPKFYAVRAGHKPGIYHTWNDCLEQVRGFKKALCEHTLSAIPNYRDS